MAKIMYKVLDSDTDEEKDNVLSDNDRQGISNDCDDECDDLYVVHGRHRMLWAAARDLPIMPV